jgi:adenylosuccinate synthase
MLARGRVNVVIDGQWGSTGKGKLAGFLALRHDPALATCDFQSNAGHTWVSDTGEKVITRQIPSSCVHHKVPLAICAGSGITVDLLLREIEELNSYKVADRLVIHPHAHIIESKHVEQEQSGLEKVASTMKGCGAAMADKVMRRARLAKDEPCLQRWLGDTTSMVHSTIRAGGAVLAETAQGFDLSLNHGHAYPHVTSRDVNTAAALSNLGVPPQLLGEVFGCLRTYPIRVGHVYHTGYGIGGSGTEEFVGHSGPHYRDQEEITWGELQEKSGAASDVTERTTVTKRVRRVFTFSDTQLRRFIESCGPTQLFVNFINHVNAADDGVRNYELLSATSKAWIQSMMGNVYSFRLATVTPRLSFVGTGAKDSDMVVL